MKKTIFLFALMTILIVSASAQYKKNGTPDMRYNANKQAYGNSYSTPTSTSNTNPSVRNQSGYTKDDGTYVQPHVKTNINSTNHDNFSTEGNTNPNTGESGSRAKDYSPNASNYGSGKTIETGSNGGQYYINSNGNKTYVPKR
jgi:hypothetical protein